MAVSGFEDSPDFSATILIANQWLRSDRHGFFRIFKAANASRLKFNVSPIGRIWAQNSPWSQFAQTWLCGFGPDFSSPFNGLPVNPAGFFERFGWRKGGTGYWGCWLYQLL